MNHNHLTVPRLHVGAGTTVQALTAFPVWVEAPSVRGLHWSGRDLAISERDDGPSVGELTVTNRSARPAVVLEGDLVEGGWQHRMVATSSLLAAGSTSALSARCVEQGRWHGDPGHRLSRRRAAYSVHAARRDGNGSVDQGDVWRRIDRFEQEFGRTNSASMVDHLRERPAPRMPLIEGQRGVIIGIGGQVVAAEIFGRSRGLASRWDGIIAAAWLDAQRAPSTVTSAEKARELVRRIGPLPLRPVAGAGLGRQIRAQDGPMVLQGLALDGPDVVHLSALDVSHPFVLAA